MGRIWCSATISLLSAFPILPSSHPPLQRDSGMTCRNEKCLSLLHRTLVALFHLVTKEHLVLIRGTAPTLKESQISICGADQVEDLLTLKKQKDTISKMSSKVLLGEEMFQRVKSLSHPSQPQQYARPISQFLYLFFIHC